MYVEDHVLVTTCTFAVCYKVSTNNALQYVDEHFHR